MILFGSDMAQGFLASTAAAYVVRSMPPPDTIFANRTDKAVVRVVVPAVEGGAAACGSAIQVVQLSDKPMLTNLPPKESAGS